MSLAKKMSIKNKMFTLNTFFSYSNKYLRNDGSQNFFQYLEDSSSDEDITSFFDFCKEIHELFNCSDAKCDIHLFLNTLGIYLADMAKTTEWRKDFFVSHCSNFVNAVKSMYSLSLNKTYTTELLTSLNKLRKGNQQ